MGAPEVNLGQFWGISALVGYNSSLIITTRNPDSKELMQQEFIRGKKKFYMPYPYQTTSKTYMFQIQILSNIKTSFSTKISHQFLTKYAIELSLHPSTILAI